MNSSAVLWDKGMRCLEKELGLVDAERFISMVNAERLDYTAWRQDQYEGVTVEELTKKAAEYERCHPVQWEKGTII